MPTDSCDRCHDSVSTPLLREIELRVDGAEVDAQAVCPDCFADWIGQYQQRLASDAVDASDEQRPATGRDDSATESVSTARDRRGSDNEIREVGRLAGADDADPAGDADEPDDDETPRLR